MRTLPKIKNLIIFGAGKIAGEIISKTNFFKEIQNFDLVDSDENKIGKKIYNKEININCLPCALFDPVWLTFDCDESSRYSDLNNFDDFFK